MQPSSTSIHFDLIISVTCKQKDIPAPDLINLWLHYGWSSIWDKCQIRATENAGGNTSLFHVKGSMSPLQCSSSFTHVDEDCIYQSSLKQVDVFDLLKIHFFTELPQKIERRYTCSIPLSSVMRNMRRGEDAAEPLTVEAWSRADPLCDKTDRGLEDVYIQIQTPKVWIHQAVNEKVKFLQAKPLKSGHCRRVKKIGNWIATQLKNIYPNIKTGFINIRVPGPDWELLYPDTQYMFSLQECNLPPSLAVYTVCNALRLHSVTPDTFLNVACFPAKTKQVDFLLNVIRDVLVPWTMCRVEGRYYPDTCLGKDCDDQPFVMVDIPGENVTPKEDCEGRAQVVLHMVRLFICMYQQTKKSKSAQISHWKKYPIHNGKNNCLIFPEGTSCPLFTSLLQVCFCIGRLFEEQILEVHMSVGDVYFSSDKNNPEGHAYCVLRYNNNREYRGIILEATAWDATREASEVSAQLPHYATAAANNLVTVIKQTLAEDLSNAEQHCLPGDTKQPCSIYVRSDYTPEHRASTYSETFTCNGCLLFNAYPSAHQRPALPTYGVSVEAFSTQLPLVSESTTDAPRGPFRISVRSFISALRDGQHGWPRVQGAEDILHQYDKYRRDIDGYKEVYRPPLLQEAEIMRRMRKWQPLGVNDVICEQMHDPLNLKHSMAFCWIASAAMPALLKDAIKAAVSAGIVTESACMQSRVFSFHTPNREAKAAVRFF